MGLGLWLVSKSSKVITAIYILKVKSIKEQPLILYCRFKQLKKWEDSKVNGQKKRRLYIQKLNVSRLFFIELSYLPGCVKQ